MARSRSFEVILACLFFLFYSVRLVSLFTVYITWCQGYKQGKTYKFEVTRPKWRDTFYSCQVALHGVKVISRERQINTYLLYQNSLDKQENSNRNAEKKTITICPSSLFYFSPVTLYNKGYKQGVAINMHVTDQNSENIFYNERSVRIFSLPGIKVISRERCDHDKYGKKPEHVGQTKISMSHILINGQSQNTDC